MIPNRLIYIVEDEAAIAEMVAEALSEYGFETAIFRTGGQALRQLKQKRPVLCIVDLGLPDMDGLSLVRELGDNQGLGVMILTGRGSLPDRVLGLEIGADDYVIKPFDPRELVARVNSLLRRLDKGGAVEHRGGADARACFDRWRFYPATLTLESAEGHSEALSSAEAELLKVLLASPRQVLSRDQLMGKLMGRESMPFDRSIDVRMSRIRKKIELDPKTPRIIKTVYGVGYLFAAEVTWENGG